MEKLGTAKLGLEVGVIVPEEGVKADGGELEALLLQESEGEGDFYCDKTLLIQEDHQEEPLPDWIIDLRQPDFIRSLMDAHFGRLRMAA